MINKGGESGLAAAQEIIIALSTTSCRRSCSIQR
jgi:hypothetical protein